MAQTIEALAERTLSAPPGAVYDAWLDANAVRSWMAAALKDFGLSGDVRRIEIDPREGGRFKFSDMREDGEAVHWGTYRELDRPRKVVFSWFTSEAEENRDASLVTLTLTPEGEGCRVRIRHAMPAEFESYRPRVENGWATMLRHIDDYLARPEP